MPLTRRCAGVRFLRLLRTRMARSRVTDGAAAYPTRCAGNPPPARSLHRTVQRPPPHARAHRCNDRGPVSLQLSRVQGRRQGERPNPPPHRPNDSRRGSSGDVDVPAGFRRGCLGRRQQGAPTTRRSQRPPGIFRQKAACLGRTEGRPVGPTGSLRRRREWRFHAAGVDRIEVFVNAKRPVRAPHGPQGRGRRGCRAACARAG